MRAPMVRLSGSFRSMAAAGGLFLVGAAMAAVAGWWWWTWWSPAPTGKIYLNQVTQKYAWYPTPFDPGETHVASSTLEFAVAGFAIALIYGLLVGYVGRGQPLRSLVIVGAAGIFGPVVMHLVGSALSQPDPTRWADAAHLGEAYTGGLTVVHAEMPLWSWLANLLHRPDGELPLPTVELVWIVGALFGFLCVTLALLDKALPSRSSMAPRADRPRDPCGL